MHAVTESLLLSYMRPISAKRGRKSDDPLQEVHLTKHHFIRHFEDSSHWLHAVFAQWSHCCISDEKERRTVGGG
jgi:hypothetical protein